MTDEKKLAQEAIGGRQLMGDTAHLVYDAVNDRGYDYLTPLPGARHRATLLAHEIPDDVMEEVQGAKEAPPSLRE